MNRAAVVMITCTLAFGSCYQSGKQQKAAGKKNQFVYKETIVSGKDTGMIRLGLFKRSNIADILCQRWEIERPEDVAVHPMTDSAVKESFMRGMAFFKDSSVLFDPFGKIKIGTWRVEELSGNKILSVYFSAQSPKQYFLRKLSSSQLVIGIPGLSKFSLDFIGSAQIHQNMHNDPFHPVNNKWRIKPGVSETDLAIYLRLKNCLLFFALYYRDHIKRQAETISFEGLPEIFEWYNRGIGLPAREELSDSWINCFYNKEQATKAYSILRKLIVDYEYSWPKGAPGWTYETHSVLEQMYHKIDKLKLQSATDSTD